MRDVITVLVAFFVSVLVVWLLTLTFQTNIFGNANTVNSISNSTGVNRPQVANVLTGASGFFTGFNTIFAFAYIFFAFGAIIAAYFTDSHPIFGALGLLLIPIELLLSFGFHDAFFSMISNSAFTPLTTQYPFMVLTFQWLPLATGIIAFIVLILTFGKS